MSLLTDRDYLLLMMRTSLLDKDEAHTQRIAYRPLTDDYQYIANLKVVALQPPSDFEPLKFHNTVDYVSPDALNHSKYSIDAGSTDMLRNITWSRGDIRAALVKSKSLTPARQAQRMASYASISQSSLSLSDNHKAQVAKSDGDVNVSVKVSTQNLKSNSESSVYARPKNQYIAVDKLKRVMETKTTRNEKQPTPNFKKDTIQSYQEVMAPIIKNIPSLPRFSPDEYFSKSKLTLQTQRTAKSNLSSLAALKSNEANPFAIDYAKHVFFSHFRMSWTL
jgi:hypothetical protein